MSAAVPNLLAAAAAARRDGCAVAACVIVSAHGSTPQPAGALMFVDDLGRAFGTIGGGCVEAELRRRAIAMLGDGASGIVRFQLDGDSGWDDGLICGGTVELAVAPAPPADELERLAADIEARRPARLTLEVENDSGGEIITMHLPPRPRLYIAGAGHIGQAAARHGVALDFEVTLFDDRPDLLARFTPPVRTVCGPLDARLAEAPIDADTYCLIVTRGHRHDARALAAVIDRDPPRAGAAYIGMIGSRRKVKVIFDELAARGARREQIERVHAPVGVEIGAKTVEEIAVSIAAQLVQVRHAGRRNTPMIERSAATAAPIGVLLAAGRGRRMGRTKQILPVPGDARKRAMIAAAFDAVAGVCRNMVVVLGHDADRVGAALGDRSFTSVDAPPDAEMIESVVTGLREAAAIDVAAPALLQLADHPRVHARTLDAMLRTAAAHPGRAVIPTCDDRGGHPILIPPVVIKCILQLSAATFHGGGLREFWIDHPELCVRLPVDDPAILLDIDVPAEYHLL